MHLIFVELSLIPGAGGPQHLPFPLPHIPGRATASVFVLCTSNCVSFGTFVLAKPGPGPHIHVLVAVRERTLSAPAVIVPFAQIETAVVGKVQTADAVSLVAQEHARKHIAVGVVLQTSAYVSIR